MVAGGCPVCGKALAPRAGRTGRGSVYCSAACRQKAYRERRQPQGLTVQGLIDDIGRKAGQLAPRPAAALYATVTELSESVARLRRVARTARDTAQDTGDSVTATPVTAGAVTTTPVTQLTETDFATLTEQYRREIQVHCYRMTGSYDEAEDLVQETFLRAWRARDGFQGRASARTWLYRIATNACLDLLRRTARRPQRYEPVPGMNHGDGEPPVRVTWLQPYPDDEMPLTEEHEQPESAAVSRETLELVLLAAIQHLPPRQRAALVLRDALGLTAAETAEALETSVASVNSALQRARPTLREHLPRERADWRATVPTDGQQAVLDRYMAAVGRLDFDAMGALLTEDITLTMPPNPFWFVGRDAVVDFVRVSLDPASPMFFGHWRSLPTRANGQLATAHYVRRPGTGVHRAQVLDVLRFGDDGHGDRIAEITSFEPHLFPAFGLPLRL
ncbi:MULTISPECIES: sigma-70 family RNA polymerase sigma factor [unclassified Streptomyces]|uniref:sigma-70 family RNA polymerase sigma factor n=1 Tax=unclassified Streptomyces TaxID=2593676 RepID=UPI0024754A96|nr:MULTISPECIES: sigma-70 family RNA polymerase sigma factor [unclassified Streptomyces]MDH6450236.1 RNA polymerase sigma-70 factor (TIGR02960 family) [Streptomyces sp. SAI-119]MDH6499220.1 RNA polymerase sigma-70 factor (TIGR02960 family) [Streptomyces sp. SAI-149]